MLACSLAKVSLEVILIPSLIFRDDVDWFLKRALIAFFQCTSYYIMLLPYPTLLCNVDREFFAVKIIRSLNFCVKNISLPDGSTM